MDIEDILKPKSDEEIQKNLENLSTEELFKLYKKTEIRDLVVMGIKKAGTKVYVVDYETQFNPTQYWYFVDILYDYTPPKPRYIELEKIIKTELSWKHHGYKNEFTIGFFAARFKPVTLDNEIGQRLINQREELDKILKLI